MGRLSKGNHPGLYLGSLGSIHVYQVGFSTTVLHVFKQTGRLVQNAHTPWKDSTQKFPEPQERRIQLKNLYLSSQKILGFANLSFKIRSLDSQCRNNFSFSLIS